jgi:hypothetical protein
MLNLDPVEHVALRRQVLLAEAEQERLIALLPRHRRPLRRRLAMLCQRLAEWLESSAELLQAGEAAAEDRVAPLGCA